ncbi:MAG: DNA polymerase III subunit delta [Anaerolineae bacterium]|jgi:DNA polymerase-3 subunit delta|nr:DNA polymerase III subunit delta [Anaerolineae bacterium]
MNARAILIHGEDDVGIEEALNKWRASMGTSPNADFNISEFDGQVADVPEIIAAVSSYPFLADARMVIVRGMLKWLTRKGAGESGKAGLSRLADELPHLPAWARLIFVERETIPDSHPTLKALKELGHAEIQLCAIPKDLPRWLMNRAQKVYHTPLDEPAARALALVVGTDLRGADNELCKLADYVGDVGRITEADVAVMTSYLPEVTIWGAIKDIAEGRGRKALERIHQLLMDKKSNDPFGIMGMIIRQFRFLLLTKEYLSAPNDGTPLADILGVKSAGEYISQSKAFRLEDLEHIYKTLQEYDFKMKVGMIAPETALDILIIGLSK